MFPSYSRFRIVVTCTAVTAALAACGGRNAPALPTALTRQLPNSAVAPGVTTYQLTSHGYPLAIAAGSGSLWFTVRRAGFHGKPAIGNITTTGTIKEYRNGWRRAPGGRSVVMSSIAEDSSGNFWFTAGHASQGAIGKITTSGAFAFYASGLSGFPSGITAGPDGNMWFTEAVRNKGGPPTGKIGKITSTGSITEFSGGIPAHAEVSSIALGSDGNLWFAQCNPASVGRITTAGTVTEFSSGLSETPEIVAPGPDGDLWFTEYASYPSQKVSIGKITTKGAVTEYSNGISADARRLDGITAGPNNSLWFTESGNGRIGQITTTGTITEHPTGNAGAGLDGIAEGPDGSLWFAQTCNQAIGRFIPPPP